MNNLKIYFDNTERQVKLILNSFKEKELEDEAMSNCCSGKMDEDRGICMSCEEHCEPVNMEKMEIESRAMVAEEENRLSKEKKYE